MSYQHILAAIDYSAHGKSVLGKAQQLAEQYQASLSVIHVIDNLPLSGVAYGTEVSLDKLIDNPLLEAERALFTQELARLNKADYRAYLVWGIPKHEVVDYAEHEGVDLIVMGSHGRHGLNRLLGSTANAVLHHAQCDVLAVRIEEG